MVKSCLLFCFSLIISNNATAQTEIDSLIITRTISNVVFVSGKSLFKFTKVIQHDGVFVFTDYPIDSSYKRNNLVENKTAWEGKSLFVTTSRAKYQVIGALHTHQMENSLNGYYFSGDDEWTTIA